jgi:Rho-binding antiterminator
MVAAVWIHQHNVERILDWHDTFEVTPMSDYQPINCEFHDVLESLATTRKNAEVAYRDAEGTLRMSSALIQDVYVRDHAEYMTLSTGETLRLDQIVAVNGAKLADF